MHFTNEVNVSGNQVSQEWLKGCTDKMYEQTRWAENHKMTWREFKSFTEDLMPYWHRLMGRNVEREEGQDWKSFWCNMRAHMLYMVGIESNMLG